MIKSGALFATAISAASPFETMSTVASPDRSSACLMSMAMSISSSTTSTFVSDGMTSRLPAPGFGSVTSR
jgi:hypothetical protein